jgi:hypothetical protein
MAAKETLLTGKKNPKKEDKTRVQTTTTTTTLRKTTNTLTIDNSDCLVLFKEGQFYTSNGFENKTLLQGDQQEPKPQKGEKKNKQTNKQPENWNNMAYLMVTMQAFFLFLCFLLLEECCCNEANVEAKMLDDANSQRKKKKHAQRNSGESLLLLRFVR